MYNLPYHKEENKEIIHGFLKQHPFAYLSGVDQNNTPIATQIPMFLEIKNNKKVLRGHLMKQTDHHLAFLSNPSILAVFSGPHCYVSGTWYSNPNSPSTWNYMSVHIKGKMRFLEEEELINILKMTSLHFESYDENSPTIYQNLPSEFKQRVMGAIAGFEIEVDEIDTVFKLSQDRDLESYKNIIAQLNQQDESSKAIANEMDKRMDQTFPK